jgi:hypothetical protein
MKLPTHGRYGHSAITTRPTYEWPNGARLAVLVYNNIEHFAFRTGLGSDSAQPGAPQTQRNYAWRDYGNRVGLWNQLDLLDELGLPCAHNVNSAVLDAYPEIAPALRARGDEFVGHGRSNAERQDGLWEEDERRLISGVPRGHRPPRRRGAAGLARPLARADRRHARPSARGGLHLRHGLAGRRPALLDAHAQRSTDVGALSDRDQ